MDQDLTAAQGCDTSTEIELSAEAMSVMQREMDSPSFTLMLARMNAHAAVEHGYPEDCELPEFAFPWDVNIDHAKAYYHWYGLPLPDGWEARAARILARNGSKS